MLDRHLLTHEEREAFETTNRFVTGRVREAKTIEWALALRPHDKGARVGAVHVVEKAREDGLDEPWASAWALIEESWLGVESPYPEGVGAHLVARRLAAGERSGSLVEADRVTDRELDHNTRSQLLRSLVGESLGALLEQREPAVAQARLHQVLRLVGDEMRSSAAHVVVDFIEQVGDMQGRTPADVFSKAGSRFLVGVWPRDRSLVTPGVAKAFAELPAASGEAFAAAVDAVMPLLVPFDCYMLMDFGFGTARTEGDGLELIGDQAKARALLDLLDATVGSDEDATVPYDLSDALAHVESVDRRLAESRKFRRLATAARR